MADHSRSLRLVGIPSQEFATSINTSFTYLGSYADSRMTCRLISWQLPRGFKNMKPSSGTAYMKGFCQFSKYLETSSLNSPLV